MDKPNDSSETLAELAARYADQVPQYCLDIESHWFEASTPGAAPEAVEQLILQCHKLSGSAASYGLGEVSRIAAAIERTAKLIQSKGPLPNPEKTEKLVDQLVQLGSQVTLDSLHPTTQDAGEQSYNSNTKPIVYIVDDDPDQGKRLSLQLDSHGFETVSFEQLNDVREAVLVKAPAAIVADIVFPEGDTAGIEAMAALRHTGRQSLPVVFISKRTDAEARLLALRMGGSGYFTKPVSAPSLAAKLHELTDQVDQHPFRIMIIDDDNTTNKLHATILKKAGCDVFIIANPLEALQEAFSFRPELIFLDLYMPEANGLEVAMMLRQEESFVDVPIVFLSGEEDHEIKARAVKEGAATFLNKPVSATDLVEVAKSRAAQYRSRAIKTRYFGRIEPVTGLFTQEYFFNVLNQQCSKKQSQPGSLALVMLDIDSYDYLFRSLGEDHIRLLRARIANLIRNCLGQKDIAASYTESSFLILAQQPDMQHLEKLLEELHQGIASKPVEIMGHSYKITASIGASKVSDNDQRQILSEATLACNQAQNNGGNQIQLHSHLRHDALEEAQTTSLKKLIKGAIKHRRIFLSYSPVVGIAIESAERFTVFMRLRDSEGKVLYPAEFIPVAEKYDIMSGLDRWTVRTALLALQEEQETSPDTQFFLKLSQSSILDPEFMPWLKTVLKKHPVQPGSCIFEIKEEDLVGNIDRVQDFSDQLHEMNCKLSIERFGRNKDSLVVLHLLRPDYLRLDLDLLHHLSTDDEKQGQVKEICNHAHEKDSKVLTAYIQDAQTLSLIWSMGVDYIQGDFLEQPEDLRQQDDPDSG